MREFSKLAGSKIYSNEECTKIQGVSLKTGALCTLVVNKLLYVLFLCMIGGCSPISDNLDLP